MDKKLPFKMLIDLKNHLGKRGIIMFNSLKVILYLFLLNFEC